MPTPLPEFASFNDFSFLCLNNVGSFVDLPKGVRSVAAGNPVPPDALPQFLKRNIYLPKETTDVFVWVHGWRNKMDQAISTARRLFGNLNESILQLAHSHPKSAPIVPAFLAIHWPSNSAPTRKGYETIRDLAATMTNEGDAEFFLAALLGYLDAKNERTRTGKVLRARGGYYIHCVGHSFGCRFLTAAVRAAGRPQARSLCLLRTLGVKERRTLSARSERLFEFTVDSVCFLQMAAPAANYSDDLMLLVDKSPLRGPVMLTYSPYDRANCFWHKHIEGECGIGCGGAQKPVRFIGKTVLRSPSEPYPDKDFSTLIVNVDASAVYNHRGVRLEGAHSDFWYEETMHLILSLVNHSRK